ncbi:MAG: hypothetical protein ACE15D_00380 [Candidatus Eisenbacteria bacterium]
MTGPLAAARPAIVSLAAALLLTPLAARLAGAIGFLDLPRDDRHHRRAVPLLGGAACLAAAACGLLLAGPGGIAGDRRLAAALAAGVLGLFALGLRDDRAALRALPKAAAEAAILAAWIVLLPFEGRLAGLPARGAALAAAIVLVNAWNYLDHADGVFASASIGSAALLVAGAAGAAPDLLPLPLAALGAAAGFLAWNRPPARIFLGDAGSLSLGCLLVSASLLAFDRLPEGRAGFSIAAQAVPLAEMLLVSAVRLREGRNPFLGGCEHSGHRIAARWGAAVAPLPPLLASAALGGIAWLAGRLGLGIPLALAVHAAAAGALAAALATIPAPGQARGGRARGGPDRRRMSGSV